ncbi:acyltransferase [Hymenobacter sp. H14-R3]|uniref:acyltransferase n=1 Tax=Hymenobacter sp. H14-R3 TaxID=3046308 RepID=UPI0024BAE884|nr:acyltransferase [Hymenobacter sp. H14-R3]MDJ0364559.1 acyltransferase [Hymenobacter sp. H14-R3]
MAFLSKDEIESLGFKSVGHQVQISDKASIYGAEHISIGDYSRIDDFCILSAGEGGITIGRNVHISCYVSIIGRALINIDDFSGISGRSSIYSSSDDFSGRFLTGPTVGTEFTNVRHLPVNVGRHSIVGAGCILLPGVTLGEGVAIGALSLVINDCAAFGIYLGSPARWVKERRQELLEKEKEFLKKNRT